MKKFTIPLLLIICSICYSQSEQSDLGKQGTLFFKNGTSKKGLIRIGEKTNIWFRKHKDSAEILHNFNDVTKFNTISNKGTVRDYHYELVPDRGKTKVILVDEDKGLGTLFFKDKTEKKGFIEFKNNSVIFKENEGDEEVRYDFNSIYKLSINNENGDVDEHEYKLVIKENKTKVELLQKKVDGKVNLYIKTINGYNLDPTLNMQNNSFGMGNDFGGGTYIKYYLAKKDDLYATKILLPNTRNGRFRKGIAPLFFSDCKELMKKINDKYFDRLDFTGLVNYYNNQCK